MEGEGERKSGRKREKKDCSGRKELPPEKMVRGERKEKEEE